MESKTVNLALRWEADGTFPEKLQIRILCCAPRLKKEEEEEKKKLSLCLSWRKPSTNHHEVLTSTLV